MVTKHAHEQIRHHEWLVRVLGRVLGGELSTRTRLFVVRVMHLHLHLHLRVPFRQAIADMSKYLFKNVAVAVPHRRMQRARAAAVTQTHWGRHGRLCFK
jgi:hypothetical protein